MGNQPTHYSKLPDNQVLLMCVTQFESLLYGVQNIRQNKQGEVTVLYNDGTQESKVITKCIQTDGLSVGKIVSIVQSDRL